MVLKVNALALQRRLGQAPLAALGDRLQVQAAPGETRVLDIVPWSAAPA